MGKLDPPGGWQDKMIGVRLQGRLGNQLFQYAFILAAQKKLNCSFYIDQSEWQSSVDDYFVKIRRPHFKMLTRLFRIKGYKSIFNFHLRRLYFYRIKKLLKLHMVVYNNFEIRAADVPIEDRTLYVGYFQSEDFFSDIREHIREKFRLKQKFTEIFENKYADLYRKNKVVSVHIRRTDYKNLGNLKLGGDDLSLPLQYYKTALSKFDGEDVHFIFVSDDTGFVKENFDHIVNKTISEDNEIMDFQHLLNANSCIISNSTFSWWGAWLNSNPNKVIYAPRYFMGWRLKQAVPADIYPEGWRLVDF